MGHPSADYPSTHGSVVASPGAAEDVAGTNASRSAVASVSAGIAEANAHPHKSSEAELRFPLEDGGQSLAEMACSDLDAALQLLADRAQYITGASGAAIALRRGEHADMLCRASAGTNAPELGALLSMEYGLSGESVRTRQAMRCDDAERDPRVNREGCRQLGIASVVVMPIVSDEQALGVFELFSGKPNAFDERDISALKRLSEMVETAVKYAVAAQAAAGREGPDAESGSSAESSAKDAVIETVEIQSVAQHSVAPRDAAIETFAAQPDTIESAERVVASSPKPALPVSDISPQKVETPLPDKTVAEAAPKKPLFWSAATTQEASREDKPGQPTAVPPMLRNLQKCQACGFPVSQGRKLCVECEEKEWRGQRQAPVKSEVTRTTRERSAVEEDSSAKTSSPAKEAEVKKIPFPAPAAATTSTRPNLSPASIDPPAVSVHAASASSSSPDVPAKLPARPPENISAVLPETSTLFLNSTMQSESWLAANKYILMALLVVAIAIGAIVWLH